jgi:hypothetical protein
MYEENANGVPKTHPATREMLADDPLSLHGFEVEGDVELMLRMLVEEYARMGWGVEEIMRLACDPFYVAFHSLVRRFGVEGLRSRVEAVLSRVGVTRVRLVEAPAPESLVQLQERWS